MIKIIASVAKNGVIGRKGDLPWKLPADLSYFLEKTANHYLIMGKNTYYSIKSRFDKKYPGKNKFFGKGRKSIILTIEPIMGLPDEVYTASSIEQALKIVGENDVFIIGGAFVYKEFIDIADELYISDIDAEIEDADAFFPQINLGKWVLDSEKFVAKDAKNEYNFSCKIYKKAKNMAENKEEKILKKNLEKMAASGYFKEDMRVDVGKFSLENLLDEDDEKK